MGDGWYIKSSNKPVLWKERGGKPNSEEEINYLQWLTRGELPREILKETFNHKINEKGELSFKFKVGLDTKDWKFVQGGTHG